MIVITASAAKKLQVNSLFEKGGTLHKEKYCTGKYGSNLLGRDLQPSSERIKAIFSERRTDADGVYFVLYCLTKNN